MTIEAKIVFGEGRFLVEGAVVDTIDCRSDTLMPVRRKLVLPDNLQREVVINDTTTSSTHEGGTVIINGYSPERGIVLFQTEWSDVVETGPDRGGIIAGIRREGKTIVTTHKNGTEETRIEFTHKK